MATEHRMSLNDESFALMASGRKQVEVRLYDEKRQRLQVGDVIVFEQLPARDNAICATISQLQHYPRFEDLYRDVGFEALARDDKDMHWRMTTTWDIYSPQAEAQYGALAIYLKDITT